MTRKRKLKAEEAELWQQVARTTDPMHPKPKTVHAEDVSGLRPAPKKPRQPVPRFEIGATHPSRNESHLPPMPVSDQLAKAPVTMDAKSFGRMKRGKLVPEGRMDLHGMTVSQAHPALIGFIMNAHARGLRLVLVITGKGQKPDPYDPMPMRRGVLKQQVPQWLKMPPVAGMVLQISEAHIKHGGGGAYYVYLRRRR